MPDAPYWITDASDVAELLDMMANGIEIDDEEGRANRYVLTSTCYRTAAHTVERIIADTVERIAAEPPDEDPDGKQRVRLLTLPVFELDALREVLAVLRRAQDGDPVAKAVRSNIDFQAGACMGPRLRIGDCVTIMQRVLAVLTLDIPAVHSVAAALESGRARDADFGDAFEQLVTAWKGADIDLEM